MNRYSFLDLVVININDNLSLIFLNPRNLDLLRIGAGKNASRQINCVFQAEIFFKLVDGRPFHITGDTHKRTGDRNKNHIPCLQHHIRWFITLQKKLIKVKSCDDPVFSFQLHIAHGTDFRRPAGQQQCVGNRCKRTDRISARPFHVAQDKHRNCF